MIGRAKKSGKNYPQKETQIKVDRRLFEVQNLFYIM